MAESVDAIAAHLAVPGRDVELAPRQGQVNLTVYLGEDLVLRIPRKQSVEDRLAKEAAVIPIVQAAGVPTSGVVAYDASRTTADVPYIVLERLRGQTLAEVGYDPEAGARTHRSLGEILTVLHALRRSEAGPVHGVAEPAPFVPAELVDRLTEAGEMGMSQGRWLMEWFGSLRTHLAFESEPVLLHGDVIPSNLLVDDHGEVAAVIDWGSACWGDPVRDFAAFPTRALPDIISGYRSALQSLGTSGNAWHAGRSLEAGALWYQLCWALAKLLGAPSTSEERNWSAPRTARLWELMRFLAQAPSGPWPELLPKSPA